MWLGDQQRMPLPLLTFLVHIKGSVNHVDRHIDEALILCNATEVSAILIESHLRPIPFWNANIYNNSSLIDYFACLYIYQLNLVMV